MNGWPRLIALSGLAGSGKTTAAKMLIQNGYQQVKFAGVLKDMCRAMGMSESMIEGDLKELPHPALCGKSPRRVMQLLGTEFGRNMIGEDLWVNFWLPEQAKFPRVVVDDCRMPNEANAVHAAGGLVIRLVRTDVPTTTTSTGHESEDLDRTTYNLIVENCGTDRFLLRLVATLNDFKRGEFAQRHANSA